MASLLLESSIGRAAKAAKDHVNGSLGKVRERPWAIQLGQTLETSSKVVGAVEDFVPGAKLIGGALSFGATLFNPESSMEDLQKEFIQIQQESNRKNSEELSGLKDVMNKIFLVAVDTRFKVGLNLCCLCVESFFENEIIKL